jgi:hypothetical protein
MDSRVTVWLFRVDLTADSLDSWIDLDGIDSVRAGPDSGGYIVSGSREA